MTQLQASPVTWQWREVIQPKPSFLLATSVVDGNFKGEWWVPWSLMANGYICQSTSAINSTSMKVKSNSQIWSTVSFVVERVHADYTNTFRHCTSVLCSITGISLHSVHFLRETGFMLNSAWEQQGRTPISGGVCTNLTGPLCREVYWTPSNGGNMSFGSK